LRTVIALAVENNLQLEVHQVDGETAHIYGKLEEEIDMEQPEGYSTGDGKYCKLNKSLYGLKQKGKIWNSRLHKN
jgi:hypothetical protein